MQEYSSKSELRRSPISLAFMFYLVTFGAILSACMRPLAGSEMVTGRVMAVLVGIGVGIGLLSGLLLGGLVFRSFLATAIAAGVGVAVGAIAGGLALVETERFVELGFIAFGGSWIMIVVMCVSARFRAERRTNP